MIWGGGYRATPSRGLVGRARRRISLLQCERHSSRTIWIAGVKTFALNPRLRARLQPRKGETGQPAGAVAGFGILHSTCPPSRVVRAQTLSRPTLSAIALQHFGRTV